MSRSTRSRLFGSLFAAALLAGLMVFAASASADYEQAKFEGEIQHFASGGVANYFVNGGVTGMAVNVDGHGGVEPGTFYAVTEGVASPRAVLRFSPGAEGEEPQFLEAWGWGIGDGHGEFERCGPVLPTEPAQHTFHTCQEGLGGGGGEEAGHFVELAGVAVDQATGYVYVLNGHGGNSRKHHLIEIFTATGTPVGEGFGDEGRESPPEAIAEGPSKLHNGLPTLENGIAVDESGTVYVNDRDFSGIANPQSRAMSFEPEHPGDYEHYVYAGQSKDIVSPGSQISGLEFTNLALIGANRIVAASQARVREYATGGGSTPLCNFPVTGQLKGMTANPLTGEVFYTTFADRKLHRLGPCNEATGEFKEIQAAIKPEPLAKTLVGMALNPSRSWGPQRPAGVLYGIPHTSTSSPAIGDVFVPAKAFAPEVLSESVANTTATSSTLKASIDPRGFTTGYAFQYLSEEAYEANEPNEVQSLTVSATGGLFGLGFEGRHLGGAFSADLASGSKTAENLVSAKGLADVHAAKGTATLSGAVGKGAVIAGSKTVTVATTTEGAFAVGQTIAGKGIPSGTTIAAVSGPELTLSVVATETEASTTLKSGTTTLTSLATSEGSFEVGETIEGSGIPAKTTIRAATATELTLSKATEKPGTAVAITAGSLTLTGALATEGRFEAGTPISGEGIQPGATITAVHSGSLQISIAPNKPGSGVAISSRGPTPLAVGETVEGPGIPPGTTILAAQAGKLTLSNAAESTSPGAHLRAGLPFDASALEVQGALEGLSSIGEGNVAVSGGPGDETGSSPYEVEFTGSLTNRNLPELEADASGLSGGPATATLATENDGGEGFSSGASEVPVGGGEIASTGVGTASAAIGGLAPDTRYRLRVIASSACEGESSPPCETVGEADAFATYATAPAGLPDGRAYELVSPAQKNGGEVFPAEPGSGSCIVACKPPGGPTIISVFPMQSAPSGDAVAYMGHAFSPNEGASVFNSFISTRTPGGWQTAAMSPRALLPQGGENLAYNGQLSKGVIFQGNPQLSSEAPAGYGNLYLQSASDPAALQPLLTRALFEGLTATGRPYRTPGSLVVHYAGYSGDFSAQLFRANDSLTEATPYAPQPPDPTFLGQDLYEWREGKLTLVNVLPGNSSVASGASFASVSPDAHGTSENGNRIYWKAGGHLYVRENGEFSTEVHDPGSFLQASADGSEVLLSDGCLYSLGSESCTDLTEGQGGFQGIAGIAEEGGHVSHVYFVDTAALPGGDANERGQLPQAGKDNLYSWSEGGVEFVTSLLASDGADGAAGLGDWVAGPWERGAEASLDGRYLAFGSKAQLTGHDNVGPCERAGERVGAAEVFVLKDAPCKEVFIYDSATGSLTCPSCNPTGEAPLGGSTLRRIQGEREWQAQPRYLTNSGRLYFDSQDRLSPRDANGMVEDVYEYEPAGSGSCDRAAGCVTLISPGSGTVDSNLLAVDESGANVFFTTRERLAQTDTDELIDLYDAREGGGFPAETETQRAECQGESCQPVAQAPNDATPASSAFHGPGNVKEATKPKKHKKKHKKKKTHARKTKKQTRTANHNRGGAK